MRDAELNPSQRQHICLQPNSHPEMRAVRHYPLGWGDRVELTMAMGGLFVAINRLIVVNAELDSGRARGWQRE